MHRLSKDSVVIITGASSGIGEATAHAFAALGCKLVLAARNMQALEQVVKPACIELGASQVLCVACDVSQQADCEQLIQQAADAYGKIDVLINNAGISMRALFAELDVDVLRKVMAVNFWGAVYCTRYAMPYLLQTKGSIVAVSSVAGIIGLPGRTGYSASKFALHGLMEALRTENLKQGLHVGIICPGYTASNIRNTALNKSGNAQHETPLDESKLMPASQVAQHIVQMVQQRTNFQVLTTQGKLTYWLNKFFPAWVSKQAYKVVAAEKDSPFK